MNRFDGRGVGVDFVATVDLAIADHYRCPGIDWHASNVARRRCRPRRGLRRSRAIGFSAATMQAAARPEEEPGHRVQRGDDAGRGAA
ncbi:hypothetical protein BST45_18090 [Mycobacterium shinjukuense]|nr:hypothetical protein BST45_18090 [Mycobacterium shinjukuense]